MFHLYRFIVVVAVSIHYAMFSSVAGASENIGGFSQKYEVKIGFFDSDSRLDLYVRERSQIVMISPGDNGNTGVRAIPVPVLIGAPVSGFVLRQNTDAQTFTLETNIQGTNFSSWQTDPLIRIRAIDYNLDGFLDLAIAGLSQVTNIPNTVQDQVVLAEVSAGVATGNPSTSLIPMTDERLEYIEQFSGFAFDSGYIDVVAPLQTAPEELEFLKAIGYSPINNFNPLLPICNLNLSNCFVSPQNPSVAQTLDGMCLQQVGQTNFINFCTESGFFVYGTQIIEVNTTFRDYSDVNSDAMFAGEMLPIGGDPMVDEMTWEGIEVAIESGLGIDLVLGTTGNDCADSAYGLNFVQVSPAVGQCLQVIDKIFRAASRIWSVSRTAPDVSDSTDNVPCDAHYEACMDTILGETIPRSSDTYCNLCRIQCFVAGAWPQLTPSGRPCDYENFRPL